MRMIVKMGMDGNKIADLILHRDQEFKTMNSKMNKIKIQNARSYVMNKFLTENSNNVQKTNSKTSLSTVLTNLKGPKKKVK